MLIVRIIGCLVYTYLIWLVIKRFIRKKQTCMIGSYIYGLGVLTFVFSVGIFIGYSQDESLKYTLFNFVMGTIFYCANSLISLISLMFSSNYRLVIEEDKYIFYNIFGIKKSIFFDSIIVKDSFYKLGSKPKLVLSTKEKKFIIPLHFDYGMKFLLDSVNKQKIVNK